MRTLRRPGFVSACTATLLLGCLTAALAATLTPILIPIGGESVLSGIEQQDFAPKQKPTVELVPSPGFPVPGQTTVKAKVIEFSAQSVRFRADKGLAGVYTVLVTPAERTTPFSTGGFLIIARPAPTSVEPSSGAPKSFVTIRGSLYGDAKGSVTIGGKKASVRLWSADALQVVVPKLAPGVHPVVVRNGAGPSVTELSFRVLAPPQPGDEYFRADIAGHGRFDVDLRHPTRFFVMWDQFETVTITGTRNKKSSFPILALSISPFDPQRAAPYTVELFPALPIATIAVTTWTQSATLLHIASAGSTGSSLTVNVTSWDGEFLAGDFHGRLVDGLGGSAAPIEITNGEFRVRPGDAP